VNFLVAHGAVLKHRRTQIMKRRRHDARHFGRHRGEIRVTLEAYKTDIGAYQHPRIRRAMRLVTRLAAFKADRSVFEGERSALVAMAGEAPRLIGREALEHRWPDAAMGIVAVHAAHGAFGKFVMKRPLELRPDIQVAAPAQLISRFGLASHQRFAGMHLVAFRARNLVLGVAAFQPADLRGLVQMTVEADFVGCRSCQFRRNLDVIGRGPLGVRLSRAVAGLAGAALPTAFLI